MPENRLNSIEREFIDKPGSSVAIFQLKAGPEYTQAAVKTERAAKQLRWIRSGKIAKPEEKLLRAEREAYEAAFAEAVREITGGK